mmetsp:Transcript_133193/g.371281  ORF Transcript_133193/g.371281 Transcript_133193/m.371281 type:complete len:264 (-) Transcript_133193:209-1000(-)
MARATQGPTHHAHGVLVRALHPLPLVELAQPLGGAHLLRAAVQRDVLPAPTSGPARPAAHLRRPAHQAHLLLCGPLPPAPLLQCLQGPCLRVRRAAASGLGGLEPRILARSRLILLVHRPVNATFLAKVRGLLVSCLALRASPTVVWDRRPFRLICLSVMLCPLPLHPESLFVLYHCLVNLSSLMHHGAAVFAPATVGATDAPTDVTWAPLAIDIAALSSRLLWVGVFESLAAPCLFFVKQFSFLPPQLVFVEVQVLRPFGQG